VSHTALSMAVSLEDCPDLAIIPESLLAVRPATATPQPRTQLMTHICDCTASIFSDVSR
jgi:hypothetical protein